MPVVMIPGNHDAHDERSLYANLGRDLLPRNLHLILEPAGTLLDFPGTRNAHLGPRAGRAYAGVPAP